MTQAAVRDSTQNFPPGCQTRCSETENEIIHQFYNLNCLKFHWEAAAKPHKTAKMRSWGGGCEHVESVILQSDCLPNSATIRGSHTGNHPPVLKTYWNHSEDSSRNLELNHEMSCCPIMVLCWETGNHNKNFSKVNRTFQPTVQEHQDSVQHESDFWRPSIFGAQSLC